MSGPDGPHQVGGPEGEETPAPPVRLSVRADTRTQALPLPLRTYVEAPEEARATTTGDLVTYYVEQIVGLGDIKTDFITSSLHQARERRRELHIRGLIAQVRRGNRLVIDAMGDERP